MGKEIERKFVVLGSISKTQSKQLRRKANHLTDLQ